jgi:hypothetical protein
LVTPNLEPPEKSHYDNRGQALFWPMVGNQLFQFHLIAEDLEGHEIEFNSPLIFADNTVASKEIPSNEKLMESVKKDYEKQEKSEAWKQDAQKRPLHGQSLSFAESTKPGDTTFEVKTLAFGAEVNADLPNILSLDQPIFYPAVLSAEVILPALKHFTGNSQATSIAFDEVYLKDGFAGGTNEG